MYYFGEKRGEREFLLYYCGEKRGEREVMLYYCGEERGRCCYITVERREESAVV